MKVFFAVILTLLLCSCEKANDKQQLIDRAIKAHGGYDKLQASSTWVAEVRRFQRGNSYELRNYYRPGMVRLESDLGNGERSADVIGHPHCWGKNGPMTFPCSAETRENDRPRVVMEMAAQLWSLRGDDWTLLSTSEETVDGVAMDALHARYEPLDSPAILRFRQDSGMLHSISIDGIKGGKAGTHTHEYSAFAEHCGVLMPMHNIKSFESDVWVEEDILQLECVDVDEAMFVRPEQVTEGHVEESQADAMRFVCKPAAELDGPRQLHVADNGSAKFCAPTDADAASDDDVVVLPASTQLSVYSLESSPEKLAAMLHVLEQEAAVRNYELQWPVRVMTYDNDGMGLTGEIVVEAAVAVEQKQ